jgi:hypothetical protein
MTLNLSKAFLTLSATILVVAASATSSNARPHAQQLSPTQNESVYYNHNPNYNSSPIRDNSCFSSTSLPEMYACSSHGG